jgi:hypothetical protein
MSKAHHKFPAAFKEVVLLMMLARPHTDCPISWCPDDVLFYCLNFLRHDWIAPPPRRSAFHATAETLRIDFPFSGALVRRRLFGGLVRGAEAGRALIKMLTI